MEKRKNDLPKIFTETDVKMMHRLQQHRFVTPLRRILFSSKVKLQTVRFERFNRNGSYLMMQINANKSFSSSIKRNDSSN